MSQLNVLKIINTKLEIVVNLTLENQYYHGQWHDYYGVCKYEYINLK